MRILIVHNTLNDSKSLNGVLRHYGWMAEEWNRLGHQTDFVIARAGFPQHRAMSPASRLISSDNIFDATNYIQQTWRYFPAYGWRMLTAHFVRLPEPYDVVYASTQLIVEAYAAMVIARRLNATFVAKIHHVLAAQKRRGGFFDHLFLWSERRTTRWLNRKADLLIASTHIVAADLAKLERSLGLTPREKTNIAYGVDLSRIGQNSGAPKEFDVVYLGRLHEHKGAFDLPKFWQGVLRENPNAKLLVIGEGAHRPRTEEMFREAGIADSATFTGGIEEERKNELLARARIGLSLSYEEGWGLSINEFLATGLPVVAYDLPVFHFAFPDQLVLVPAGQAERAAAEVNKLLRDPARQKELGERGKAFVQRYDYRNIARAELDAIQRAHEQRMQRA